MNALAIIAAAFIAATEPVEVRTDFAPNEYMPQTGETVIIHDHTFVVVEFGDWVRWTNAVTRLEAVAERRWEKEHKTENGRREWHGAVVKTEFDQVRLEKVTTYADGFTWTEKMQPTKRSPMTPPAAKKDTPRPRPAIPARLAEKREAMAGRKPVEVTVNHIANEPKKEAK